MKKVTPKKPTRYVSTETLSKIEKVMRKSVSKKTNAVKATWNEIAEKANVNVRTVGAAVQTLKYKKVLKTTDNGYTFI